MADKEKASTCGLLSETQVPVEGRSTCQVLGNSEPFFKKKNLENRENAGPFQELLTQNPEITSLSEMDLKRFYSTLVVYAEQQEGGKKRKNKF